MTLVTANRLVQVLGTSLMLGALVYVLLCPQWQVRLVGGQEMSPRAWWWAGPDLSLVQPVASHVDVMRMLGQGLLCAFGAWFYWWLLGRQPIVRERAGDLGAEPGELRGA